MPVKSLLPKEDAHCASNAYAYSEEAYQYRLDCKRKKRCGYGERYSDDEACNHEPHGVLGGEYLFVPGKPIGDSQQDDREGENDVVCDGGERVQAYIVGADEGQKGELPEKERL